MPKKTTNGRYHVDLRPAGRNGPRFRRTFGTQGEAIAYERHIIATHQTPEPWQPQKADKRRLSELATTWHRLHGQHLKTGTRRLAEIQQAIAAMRDPIATEFTAKHFTDWRARRVQEVTANTANHDLINLRSMFNELARLGEWHQANPLANIRGLRFDEKELSFLSHDQIRALLAELDKSPSSHARITARVCLATGARWGEAATLRAGQIRHGLVHFTGTKNGKNRSVPISEALQTLVLDHAPLTDGMNTFKRAVAKLELTLPKGQMTHILRHTFASHFMINGGNIITLQRILGHGSLAMTVRYAHLSPDHLAEALNLNPLECPQSGHTSPA